MTIHDEELLKVWKEHLTMILARIISAEVAPFADHLANHRSRIRNSPIDKSEIIFFINALKWMKAAALTLSLQNFLVQTISALLAFPHFRKCCLSERRRLLKFQRTVPECGNFRDICVPPAVAKILAKVILERIKEGRSRKINRRRAS